MEEDLLDGSSLTALALRYETRECRDSLLAFVKAAWHIIEPDCEFVCNWHIEELVKVLEDVANGKQKRVVINVPPGTMKSLLVSVLFPCWIWARNPHKRILTAAYSDKRALDANIKARNIIKSHWFQKRFKLVLVDDQDTKGRFDTKQGGWRIATSVGGEGTGLHPDFIIIDDAATAADAQSEVERKKVNDWFDQTMSSRGISRGVAAIVLGQRLHEEDLPGHLIAKGGWYLVRFPMRYMKTVKPTKDNPGYEADPRDPRKVEGELLWPSVFDEQKVKTLEGDLMAYGTAGQLQQIPAPGGGGLFKRENFKFIDAAPAVARRVRGWDTAASEGKGDWTRGCRISEARGIFFIEDMVGDKLGPDGVDKLIKVTAELDGKRCPIREEKEGGASGKAVIQARAKLLQGWDYLGVTVTGSKVVRAKPFRAQVEAGNVYLVRGGWNEAFIVELCGFPTGKHDDQVDAATCAFNAVLLEPDPQVRVHEAVWG